MGFVRMLRCIAGVAGLSALAACLTTSEPASPCPALDLGEAEAATFVAAESAPLIAITHGDGESFVAHRKCDGTGTCRYERTILEGLPAGSQVLLTASGRHVVGIAASHEQTRVMTWTVTPEASVQLAGDFTAEATDAPAVLVASLRGRDRDTDWVIARTGADLDGRRRLLRYKPGWQPSGGAGPDELATNAPGLLVMAVGERHLLGRQIHSGGEETLWLVDVTDDFGHDEARALMRGPTFSRAMLTPGDTMVVATAGEGDDAETFVFDVGGGGLIDRFSGGMISGRARGEELPGMRAVSPDGSAIAYRTPRGAIALRSLDTQSSCLVRSASSGEHELAGFSASGVLYLEASTGPGEHRAFAFDPVIRRLSALGTAEADAKLFMVPGRELVDDDGVAVGQWALGVSGGRYMAILDGGRTEWLDLDEVLIMPRDDAAMWIVDTSRGEGSSARTLRVHRLAPRVDPHTGAIDLDRSAPTLPQVFAGATDVDPEPLELRLDPQPVCLSTGGPGLSTFICGRTNGNRLTEYASSQSEAADPGAPPLVQPDEPDEGDEGDEGGTDSGGTDSG